MVQKNSFKYFIVYNDNDVIRLLCIKLPQMIEYVNNFDGNETMSFKISEKQLLKKYSQIWKRAEKLIKIEFDNKPVYCDNDIYINYQGRKMPKDKTPCKSLSITMLDSVVKAKKKYYLQTLLEECKCENLIDDDLEKKFV